VSKWPGKYIIGLTGNIATGKSVVRKMLEHLGAYGIDADALANRAIAKGAPGYQRAIDMFGRFIVGENGEIDRAKLGRLVFGDPEALKNLESIIHPLVIQAVDVMIQRAKQKTIVIEAIKLLEAGIASSCDSIWVTTAPENIQKERLVSKRSMGEADALQRIHAQPPQDEKVKAATVVIKNIGSFEDTWKQVTKAWKTLVPAAEPAKAEVRKTGTGQLTVRRGRPSDSEIIASLLMKSSPSAQRVTRDDVMEAFGDKAFLVLMAGEHPAGLAGWQVENLVARTTNIMVEPTVDTKDALDVLIKEVESASMDLQCEASLVFLTPQLASNEAIWRELGYQRRTPQSLGIQAWQDAAMESAPQNTILLFKQLRVDRVLRPI